MSNFFEDLWQWGLAVLTYWQAYATAGLVAVVLAILESFGLPISKRLYVSGAIAFLLVACFMTWREKHVAFQGSEKTVQLLQEEIQREKTAKLNYTLAFSGLQRGFDSRNSANAFEIHMILQNKSDGPLRLTVERMVATIEGHEITTVNTRPAMIAKGDPISIYPSGGLSVKQYQSLPARSTGTLNAVILYGHPDTGFARRAILSMRLVIVKAGRKKDPPELAWIFESQNEEPIESQ